MIVHNNVIARLRRIPVNWVEASMDLGADGWQTFRYVLLPQIATALLAGGMLAFALSFDEIIVTLFTAGHERTLPIWFYNELFRPRERPITNVVAVIVILVTLGPILLAYYLTRPDDPAPGRDRRTMGSRLHMQTKLLINGKLVAGAGKVEDVLDPATGKVLARVAEASREQVNAAVSAADAAFDGWARTPPKDRATLLLRLADRIEADGAGFAKVESRNCGKPYAAALADEIPAIADVFRFFAGACRSLTSAVSGEYLAGFTSMIRRDPVGVVASIAPWNYPLMMAAWKLGPALAAGNTCVLKPSEQTPLTALKLGELLAELFPAGVVNVVAGRGASVGAPLTRHPKVRMISLTGDVATGAKILRGRLRGHQAYAPRARREGAGDRVRRRGSRCRGLRGPDLRLLQRRAGLHRGLPPVRGFEGL